MFIKLERFKILKVFKNTPRIFSAKVYDKEKGKIFFLKKGKFPDVSFFKREYLLLKAFKKDFFPAPEIFMTTGRMPTLITEFVEGTNLKEKFKNFETLEKKEKFLRKILKNIFEAINFLHKNHIIHGDIKPENILIRKNTNKICITDLELSKIEEEKGITGTPGFIAPENLQGHPMTLKSDIFSLGATFYDLLFDEVPIKDRSLIYSKEEYEKNISEKLKKLSPDLQTLLYRMLAYNPSERADIDELMGLITEEKIIPIGSLTFPEFFNREKQIERILYRIKVRKKRRKKKKKNILIVKGEKYSGKTRLLIEIKTRLLREKIPFDEVRSVKEIFQPFIRKEKGIHGFEIEKILPKQVGYKVIMLDDFDELEKTQIDFFIENLEKFEKINYFVILTAKKVPKELRKFEIVELKEWNLNEKLEFTKRILRKDVSPYYLFKEIKGYPGEISYFLKKALEENKIREEKGRIVIDIKSPHSFIEKERSIENLSERERLLLEFLSFVKKIREDVLISIFGKEYIPEIQKLKSEDVVVSSPPYVICAREVKLTKKIEEYKKRMENLLDLLPYVSLFHIMPHYRHIPAQFNLIADMFFRKILEEEGAVGSFPSAKYIYSTYKNILNETNKLRIFKIFAKCGESNLAQSVALEIDINKLGKEEKKEFFFWEFYMHFLKNEYDKCGENLRILEKLYEPHKIAFIYNLNSWFYYNIGKYDMAYQYAVKGEKASTKNVKDIEYIKSQFYKSLSTMKKDEPKKAIEILKNLKVKDFEAPEWIGRYFYYLGEVYFFYNDYKNAILHLEKALDWVKFLTFYEHGFILNRLYIIYLQEGNFEKALEACSTALRWADYSLNRRVKAIDHANLGIIYKNLENLKEAEKNFREALEIAKNFKYHDVQCRTLNFMLNFYFQIGKEEKMKEIYNTEIKPLEEIDALKNYPGFHLLNGLYAFRKGKVFEAEKYLEKALKYCEEKKLYYKISFYLLLCYLLNRKFEKYNKTFLHIEEVIKSEKDFYHLFLLSLAFYKAFKEEFEEAKKILVRIIGYLENRKNKSFYTDYLVDIIYFLMQSHFVSNPGCIIYGINDLVFEIFDIFEKFYKEKNHNFYFKTLRRFRSKMAEKEKIFAGKLPATDLKLKSLLKMIEAIHEVEDPEKLFKRALDLLLTYYNVERGVIFYYNKDGKIETKVARNAMREEIEEIKDISRSVIQQAVDRGVLIQSVDIKKTPYLAERESIKKFGIRSILCIPITRGERIMGAIYLDSKKTHLFEEKDVDLLSAFARQLSIALDRLEKIRELEDIKTRMEMEVESLREKVIYRTGFYDLVGRSPKMQRVYEMMEKIIKIEKPIQVLIWGETGTGKELVARILHFHGKRKEGPFIAVNCGELPETLIEAELFGYIKGAFTGADSDRIGLFEAADGGTLFLDQIESLPLHLQSKLLRVIQYGEVRRLGSNKIKKINVMIIAASNQNLDLLVERGEFRKDLRFRLSTFEIHLPPLRERIEDIKSLAYHFLHKYREEYQKNKIAGIEKRVIDALLKYDWPGNVRELESVIQRAIVMCDGTMLRLHHLPPEVRGARRKAKKGGLKMLDRETEYRMVVEALKSTNWNILRAAKRLGISRPTLYKKIYEFGLKRPKKSK